MVVLIFSFIYELYKFILNYNIASFTFKESDKTSNKKKDKGNKKNKPETTGVTLKFVEPTIHLDFNVLYKFLSLLM